MHTTAKKGTMQFVKKKKKKKKKKSIQKNGKWCKEGTAIPLQTKLVYTTKIIYSEIV